MGKNREGGACMKRCMQTCATNKKYPVQPSNDEPDESEIGDADIMVLSRQVKNGTNKEVTDAQMNPLYSNAIISIDPPKEPEDTDTPKKMLQYSIARHVKKHMKRDHFLSKKYNKKVYKTDDYQEQRMNNRAFWVKHRNSYHLIKYNK
jgi:hypothetical protein